MSRRTIVILGVPWEDIEHIFGDQITLEIGFL